VRSVDDYRYNCATPARAQSLRPQIAVEAPWSEIGTVARRLIDREFTGKAVLHVS
jgi:hypothetical protein